MADTFAATPTATSPTKNTPSTPPTLSSNVTAASTRSPSNAVSGAQIVQFALKYLGYPYTATGNSPSTGFSCIGFASYVYRSLGIPLPGDLQDALDYAPQVPFSQLQPGDLIFFHSTLSYMPYLSHVAIYIGGGKFVHAEYYGYGVRISSFNNDPKDYNYWIGHYMTANRPWGGASVSPVINTPSTTTVTKPAVKTTTQVAVTGGKHSAVTVPALNVRSGPSKSNSIVTVAKRGTDVAIVGKSNGWYKVELPDGTIGWVVAYGIGLANTAPAPTTTSASKVSTTATKQPTRAGYPTVAAHHAMTTITVAGLRVHSRSSLSAPVVTSLAMGEKVVVLSRGARWTKIELLNGQTGWIFTAYTSNATAATTRTASAKASYRAPAKTVKRSVQGKSLLTAGVRVHAAPGLNARVVGTAIAGTHVKILGRVGAWDHVRLPNGQKGYVYAIYVRA